MVLTHNGLVATFKLAVSATWLTSIRLPTQLLTQRVLRSYDQRSGFAQSSSLFEFIVVLCTEWAVATADTENTSSIFFSRQMSLALYLFRRFRNGGANLGDTRYFPMTENGLNGMWIRSPHRGDVHDVVIYYIHGGGFAMASLYFYLEYLITMQVSLQLQGFRNPAIFALEYPPVPKARFEEQLNHAVAGWNYLCTTMDDTNLVIAGDSTGATLGLSLLLHIAHPSPDVEAVDRRKPIAALFASPWTDLYSTIKPTRSDYLTPKILHKYAVSYTGNDHTNVYKNPGLCKSKEWWTKAFPQFGMYITFGSEEMLGPSIVRFAYSIRSCGQIKAAAQQNQVHAWPIVMNYIGRSKDERESGIEDLVSNLARMILWHTDTYPGPYNDYGLA